MISTGAVAEWEQWTGMVLPENGQYVVPDALDFVDIDCERHCGIYAETNLWMCHPTP